MIAVVDEFIISDDVQYTRRDWRNRSLIKPPQGLKWLAVSVKMNGKLTWFDYAGYPEYSRIWEGFTHGVSILDLLFNCGSGTVSYMRCART